MKPWNLVEAVYFCTALSEHLKPKKFGVALTGSVLTRGWSHKDLDAVVYPHDASYKTAAFALENLTAALTAFGMVKLFPVEVVHARWRIIGSLDEKHVEVWNAGDGRRVVVFFLK